MSDNFILPKETSLMNLQSNQNQLSKNSEYSVRLSTSKKSVYQENNSTIPTDLYKYEKVVGSGSYASVWLATEKLTGKKVAIKIYEKIKLLDKEKLKNVENEIEILRELNHPSIVGMFQEHETFRQIHIVMQYAPGLLLSDYVKKKPLKNVDEKEARNIFRQIVSGVHYLHDQEIAHRDIKLDNILIEVSKGKELNVKLIDFGFAIKHCKDLKIRTFCGTPTYMAPEITNRTEHMALPTDIWSLGVLLYRLLFGDYPFKGATDRELFQKIGRGKFHIPENWSKDVQELIRSILQTDPKERPSIKQLASNRWISEGPAEKSEYLV